MSDTKIEPSKTPIIEGCPFCGSTLVCAGEYWYCSGDKPECPVNAYEVTALPEAIAAHNQLCRYVRRGKAAEKFMEKPPLQIINLAEHPGITEEKGIFNNGVQACLDFFTDTGSGE